MSQVRRMEVLRAIIEDYVETREPVGSKALVERHNLGVSSATIRNDMAALEDDGLIAAPHTSAGRIPTDKGYRAFVDQLHSIRALTPAEKRAIQSFIVDPVDLDEVLRGTVRALATLTNMVALVQYPSVVRARVQHVEMVPIDARRLLVVLITDTGRVEQRVIDVDGFDQGHATLIGTVERLRTRLPAAVTGRLVTEAAAALDTLAAEFDGSERAHVQRVIDAVKSALVLETEERVVLAGTANLARTGVDLESLSPVLEAIEEQVVLLRLLQDMADDPASGVSVRIGHENPYERLSGTSLITSAYGVESGPGARLGVLGLTRMDYPTTMSTVRAVARYVSRIMVK